MADSIVVVGGGGHAKVVIAALQTAGTPVARVLDDNSAKWGSDLMGVPVDGPISAEGDQDGSNAILAIGDNKTRSRLAEGLSLDWVTVVHPTAWVHPSASLGVGTLICAGAVIQPDVRIGDHTIINTGATVDHDCEVGNFVHLGPGAVLAGGVRLGHGALVGLGAGVIPGVIVGDWARVGAGAAVTGDVPPGATAVGVPARLLDSPSL